MRDLKSYEPFFGAWYIRRPIFENAFGGIYEIYKQDSDEPAQSMKVIRMPDPGSGSEEEYSRKLEKDLVAEINMMTALKGHINVTAYEEYEVLRRGDGFGWDIVIRMEPVMPLPEYIRNNPFTIGDAVRLGAEVCAMLEFCHPHEIVHRNICPQNIFVSADGVYKVGDFAIEDPNGQLLSALKELDAACYTAPEVHNNDLYVPASDIYSLGILLYGLLNNNRLPFMPAYPQQYSLTDVVFANEKRFRGEEMQAPKNAGEELSAIILKACSFNVNDRYESASEMKAALLAVLYGNAPQTEAPAPAAQPQEEEKAVDSVAVVEAVAADEEAQTAEMTEEPVETVAAEPAESAEVAAEQKTEVAESEATQVPVEAEMLTEAEEEEKAASPVGDVVADEAFVSAEVAAIVNEVFDSVQKESDSGKDAFELEDAFDMLVGSSTKEDDILHAEFEKVVTDNTEEKKTQDAVVYEPEKDYTAPEAKADDHIEVPVADEKQGKNRKTGILAAIAVIAVVGVSAFGVKYFVTEPELPVDSSDTASGSISEDISASEEQSTAATTEEVTTKPAKTEVPSLTGMNAADAEILLQSLGFRVVRETTYSDTMAVDYVVSQTPVAKTQAKTGSVVTITVSIGKQANAVTSLSFVQSSVTLRVGQTLKLDYTFEPADANTDGLKWTSSASNVATVENGTVKGLAIGTTQITVRSADGKTSSVCTVAVVGESEITVPSQVGQSKAQAVAVFESLGLNVTVKEQYSTTVAKGKVISQSIEGGKTAKAGDTIALVVSLGKQEEATTVPSEPTTQQPTSSSDGTTEKPTTTPATPGTTVPSTTQNSGDNTTTTTTQAANVAVKSVSLSRRSTTMQLGETLVLVATVSPADASNKYVTWASSDSSVVSVSDGTLYAKSTGTAKITVTTADGSKTATCSVTVKDDTVSVPNVVGKTAEQAESLLKSAGFTVVKSHDFTANGTPGTVQSQYPVANSKLTKGEEVQIVVCQRVVQIRVTASEGGSVSDGGVAVPGKKITISATPDSGYRFVKWSDGNTNASRSVTFGNADETYTAYFEKIS
ncbi:MAG: PASTA domain-containing protein [Clostridia bacterium]|nr:PASTA domain-containing protein [Clostridia bacterium]